MEYDKDRDPIELDKAGGYYARHVSAMTREALHEKSDIANELGYRDMLIDQANKEIARLNKEVADRIVDVQIEVRKNRILNKEITRLTGILKAYELSDEVTIQKAKNQALEQAAKISEKWSIDWDCPQPDPCAAEIRALKEEGR